MKIIIFVSLVLLMTGCAGRHDSAINYPSNEVKQNNKAETTVEEYPKESKPVQVCHAQEMQKNDNMNNLVFGIPLGTQFTLQECKKYSIGDSYGYLLTEDNTCFKPTSLKFASIPVCNEEVEIDFPLSNWPSIPSFKIQGLIVSGQLEGITIYTPGFKTQDIVLQNLINKYSKPRLYSTIKKQNGYGAIFESHLAEWSLPNLSVIFYGFGNSLDSGFVIIETDIGKIVREKEELNKSIKYKNPL